MDRDGNSGNSVTESGNPVRSPESDVENSDYSVTENGNPVRSPESDVDYGGNLDYSFTENGNPVRSPVTVNEPEELDQN